MGSGKVEAGGTGGTEFWNHRIPTRSVAALACALLLVLAIFAATGLATAQEPPETLCRAEDSEDKYGHAGSEVWGPTDLNSQISNQRLVVGTNEKGTMTLFKYPNPSYSDQIKHHAFDRREDYYGSDPNSGAFLGAIVTKGNDTRELTWFREWGPLNTTDPEYGDHVDQRWMSEYSDTLVTEFSNQDLGLQVTVTNVVPRDHDVFVRDVEVTADPDSPVTDVELVSYENFNLVEDKDSLAPTQDWCSEDENGEDARYDASVDAVVHEDPDKANVPEYGSQDGAEFSIATSMAFDGNSTQHQVGGDDYMGDHPDDPYVLLENGSYDLPGDSEFLEGQTSVVMTRDLSFSDGQGSARVYFSAAWDPEPDKDIGGRAADKIEQARSLSLDDEIQKKEEWFRGYVEDAPMPDDAPENVRKVARRSLISIVQVWNDRTVNEHGFRGNLIAASTTQPPYGADWIRDGAYFDYVLDRFMSGDGQHDWVNRHNRWYMSVQQNPDGPCPEHCHDNNKYYNGASFFDQVYEVPEGAWAMNYYADGHPAGPIGGEIDETAYGAWTLWDHYAVTGNETYLRRIYPAIEKVGDRLTYECVDNDTGLQCARPEDDNTEKTQTIVGGASVYAGLDAATKAAAEMYNVTGDRSYAESALEYAKRRDELAQAADEHYWNESAGYYGERKGSPSPRVGMPAFMRPLDDERMRSHMESMWDNVDDSFQDQEIQGQYEAKTVIGLGVAARELDDPVVSQQQIRDGLNWIADEHARSDSTYIMGEAWVRETYADGEVDSAQGQPHTWEQSLFYLSSLIAYGNSTQRPMEDIAVDLREEWRKNDARVVDVDVADGLYGHGDTVTVNATIANDASVSQEYHVDLELQGPEGETYEGEAVDVGPIPVDGSVNVSLNWSVSSDTGEHDVEVSVWKATETGDDDTVDPEDIAREPTALAAEQYRNVELDSSSESDAFEVWLAQGKVGETGTVSVSADDDDAGGVGDYQYVPFQRKGYENPVVVAKPTSYEDTDPAHVRVRNVSSTGFDVQIEEWDYLAGDGGHATEDVSYLAMEAGEWQILNEDGENVKVEAGVTSTGENWQSVDFDQSFDEEPVVMTVVGSESGDGAYNDIYEGKVTRNRNVGTGGFETRLFYQEGGQNIGCAWGCGGIPAETVYYVAMEPGSGSNSPTGADFEVARTGNTVTDDWHTEDLGPGFGAPPSFVADMQTFDGADTSELRYRNRTTEAVEIFVEEEQSADDETAHTDEDVGYLAFDTDTSGFVYGDISENLVGEVGTVELEAIDMDPGDQGPYQTVNLVGSYDDPVVVAKPMSDDVGDYAHVRTRNLEEDSFEIQIEPWDYLQDDGGTYAPEQVSYLVMEGGEHTLPDGTDVEAGKLTTGENWHSPNGGDGFTHSGFDTTPTVITTVNSESGDGTTNDIYEAKVTRNRNVDSTGFETRLRYQDGGENIGCALGCGGIPAEVTSYVAFEGTDDAGNSRTADNAGTRFEFGANDDLVDHQSYRQTFEQEFTGEPVVVADMQTENNGDTDPSAHLRLADVDGDGYAVYVEEETSVDDETAVENPEAVAFVAFDSQGGIYDAEK